MLLRLKTSHACDVISVVLEFMVDVAEVKDQPCLRSNGMPLEHPLIAYCRNQYTFIRKQDLSCP
jgi:hypothetical protein